MSKIIHASILRRTKGKLPKLHSIIKSNGILTIERQNESDLFFHLARTVTGQQLSKKAASTIWDRVINSSASHNSNLFDFCCTKNFDELHCCGLSKFKVKAIIGLKKAFDKNEISAAFLAKANHEIIVNEITKLWGFGEWSADMIALFFFGQPDVWSIHDAALKRGIRKLSEEDNNQECEILDVVTPYKSYLSLHIWKALDTQIL